MGLGPGADGWRKEWVQGLGWGSRGIWLSRWVRAGMGSRHEGGGSGGVTQRYTDGNGQGSPSGPQGGLSGRKQTPACPSALTRG